MRGCQARVRVMLLSLVASAAGTAAAGASFTLDGGFSPDPWTVDVTAAARLPAGEVVRGCPGYMAAAPDLTLVLRRPSQPLHVHAAGERLAGLLVIGPDGIHRCTGLGEGDVATLRVDPLLPGEHGILPLAAEEGDVAVRVLVSERQLDPDTLGRALGLLPDAVAVNAEPAFGRVALAEAPVRVPLTLSGATDAAIAGAGCYGSIDPSRPDVVLTLEQREPMLAVRAQASVDTTLVVAGPDGTIRCDDDTHGLNPEVAVRNAPAGDWAVWVGVYSGNGGTAATLELSRGGAAASTPGLDHQAEPAAGRHALGPAGRLSVPVALAGGAPAGELDWACAGLIDLARPDAVIELTQDAPALHLRARSQDDTTLVVRTPGGALICNDDTYGLDPAVEAAPAPAGDYAVWVGVYSGAGGGTATIEAAFSAEAVGGTSPRDARGFGGDPFDGPVFATAAEAVEAMLGEGLGALVDYGRLEPLGREGFVLHDVAIAGLGHRSPLSIGRITLDDVDPEGLTADGGPDRFTLLVEGIDAAALAEAGGVAAAMPAFGAALAGAGVGEAAMSLRASLQSPEGEPGWRDLSVAVDFERQFALRMAVRLDWSDGAAASLFEAFADAIELEFENRGFLGHLARAHVAALGREPAQADAALIEALGAIVPPGAPQGEFLQAVAQALADPDQRGVIRLEVAADEPRSVEALLEALNGESGEGPEVAVSYVPMP